jgi:hypothetical protein
MERFAHAAARLWMPWKGKRFDSATGSGNNILDRRVRWSIRTFFPHYSGIEPDPEGSGTVRGFRFRTRTELGLAGPGVPVVVLDYDLDGNPKKVRQVRDEIVALASGAYLGKAHIVTKWSASGKAGTTSAEPDRTSGESPLRRPAEWYTLAYFSLVPEWSGRTPEVS